MKFASILISAFATVCVSLVSVGAVPVTVDLEKRTSPLPSRLHTPATFYRTVTQGKPVHMVDYQKGHHPTFSYCGDLDDTIAWGDAYTTTSPNPAHRFWYLVTFKYTPNQALKMKSFATGTDEWKKVSLSLATSTQVLDYSDDNVGQFCISNYAGATPATHCDLIEGPVSHGTGEKKKPAVTEAGNMIYQAAFVGDEALGTLVVENVVQRYPKGKGGSCIPGCSIL
ncbi:hypothetical protein NLJ89_g11068 [Agrocybe chaxingu]|uniref:Uncharacterized protein n=1 Tax=Agrocybe chaxingu TaxID=84603 RepID=A0A9W8MNC2_9AGAR|nr:hypothetical protein NLJ89_g11068 [Agrocybe chaxingu]